MAGTVNDKVISSTRNRVTGITRWTKWRHKGRDVTDDDISEMSELAAQIGKPDARNPDPDMEVFIYFLNLKLSLVVY